jgi:replication factor C small subunit
MTGIAQDALRNVMETYYSNCRFILTANNINKIIEPLQSRCFRVDLKMPDKSDIVKRLKYIAAQEAVKVESDEVFEKIADIHYPNIRDSIKMLQQLSIKGEIALKDVKPELHLEGKIYEMIKDGECESARKLWLEKGLNAEDLLLNLYKLALRDTSLKNEAKKKAVLVSAKYNFQIGFGDPELQLFAFTLQLADTMKGVV